MRVTLFITGLTVAVIATLVISCSDTSAKGGKNQPPLTTQELINRGDYLVNVIGCDDCHSPKRMGPQGPEVIEALRFSGYPSGRPLQKPDSNVLKKGWSLFGSDFTSAAGSWGISFAANISSDATGIGNWSEEQFMRAIREGKLKGQKEGRPLLPPMPWFVYKNMTDEDLKAVFAYLKTTKPVSNVVPAPRQIKDMK